ncbi:MAG: GNAT family N-acetyltransferase [Acidobacteria bacterium]|nr:GNAT family N-acetyltransferase [Acidobacteriota bacterium]
MVPILAGQYVILEPLAESHREGLLKIATEPGIWAYMLDRVENASHLDRWFEAAQAPRFQTWVTRLRTSGEIIGSTRFIDFDAHHRSVEIGSTWIAASHRGTKANPEAKFLQLTHAFEDLNLRRVALKTHHLNLQSQAAIRKLGAQYEGTFRNHWIMPDGSTRHTVWFSITDIDWPRVKANLLKRLSTPDTV